MLIKRESKGKANDLNTVYRPYLFDELVGNDINKSILKNYLDGGKLPHTLLFTGERGCGKTTAARIVSMCLNCVDPRSPSSPCMKCASCRSIIDQNCIDVIEVNVGQNSTKGSVEDTLKNVAAAPFTSKHKVYIFDEAHKLTSASIDMLLKRIEDGFSHVYFIFCTNKPEKLNNAAFIERCHLLQFRPLSTSDIISLLCSVAEFEGIDYNKDVLQMIAEESEGIPRKALVDLSKVSAEGSWDSSHVRAILGTVSLEDDEDMVSLCRSVVSRDFKLSLRLFDLLYDKYGTDGIRMTLMGYMATCLKRSGKGSYAKAIDILSDGIYESGKIGKIRFYSTLYKLTQE